MERPPDVVGRRYRARSWSAPVIRRTLAILSLIITIAGSAMVPASTLAGGPPDGAIPALLLDGPVVLPNGRVLPVRPAWVNQSSVQAEMLAEHANRRFKFEPGAEPRRLGEAGATLGLARRDTSPITPLTLAAPAGTEPAPATTAALPNGLRKEVFGFLPYWMLDAGSLQWMQYQLVSTVGYFGVEARSDGSLTTTGAGWSGWNSSAMTSVINAAHTKGVRVVLTITMMAWDGGAAQAALLGSSTARAALVNAIVSTVRSRAADGVNLDFEPVSTTLRDQYTSFVRQLKAGLVSAGAGSFLTVCTMAGAATWATGYDLAGLTAAGAADALFVMGYDYSWSGSARAGGVAPMDSPYILDVRESVDDYLSVVASSKIIWGVPYYGRTWLTNGNALNATTVAGASGSSKAYSYIGARALAATYGRRWDVVGNVPWFTYYDSAKASWAEGYYDDAASLAVKYDMVNQKNLAGVGMWTLLMDQGDNSLWGLIANKFVNDTTPPTGGIGILPDEVATAVFTVSWRALDVGSGVRSYTVQVHDRSTSTWVPWLTATTATSSTFIGVPGHAYDFRLAAVDYKGNVQPWVWSEAAPGATLTVGGYGRVSVDDLNVRSGAGTGFSTLEQLGTGDVVGVLAGPISSGGYNWYQVQFGFSEWPSADYPRIGWLAAASGGTAYMVPAKPPNMTRVAATAKPAQMVFGAGTHTGYQFNSAGAMSAAKTYTLMKGSSAPTSTRASIANQSGTWYYVTSGVWAGYWIRQSSVSWLSTAPVAPISAPDATFSPALRLTFLKGTHTGYQLSSTGVMTAQKSYTLSANSSAHTSRRSTITNQSGTWYYVTSGVWAGYWLRASDVLYPS